MKKPESEKTKMTTLFLPWYSRFRNCLGEINIYEYTNFSADYQLIISDILTIYRKEMDDLIKKFHRELFWADFIFKDSFGIFNMWYTLSWVGSMVVSDCVL